MLTPRVVGISKIVKRNVGIMAPVMQKVEDPIQQLFLDKIREYKAKSVGGKVIDPSPELEKELKNDLDRIASHYGGGPGVDMTKFPTLTFEEPKVDYSAQSSAK